MERPFTIVFILYPRLTQLDFTGPFEVLQRLPGARLVVASREGGSLYADSGLTFTGLARLSDVTEADAICVPGGHGLTAALGDRELVGLPGPVVGDAERVGHMMIRIILAQPRHGRPGRSRRRL